MQRIAIEDVLEDFIIRSSMRKALFGGSNIRNPGTELNWIKEQINHYFIVFSSVDWLALVLLSLIIKVWISTRTEEGGCYVKRGQAWIKGKGVKHWENYAEILYGWHHITDEKVLSIHVMGTSTFYITSEKHFIHKIYGDIHFLYHVWYKRLIHTRSGDIHFLYHIWYKHFIHTRSGDRHFLYLIW